jgi:hypothetical protein
VSYSVQPESSTKSAPDSLVARETDTAEALTATFAKRSDRGTLMIGSGTGNDAPHDPLPDSPRYAAMGDAITVNVAEWIGVRLKFAMERDAA